MLRLNQTVAPATPPLGSVLDTASKIENVVMPLGLIAVIIFGVIPQTQWWHRLTKKK